MLGSFRYILGQYHALHCARAAGILKSRGLHARGLLWDVKSLEGERDLRGGAMSFDI
jgi:hypothetical protein